MGPARRARPSLWRPDHAPTFSYRPSSRVRPEGQCHILVPHGGQSLAELKAEVQGQGQCCEGGRPVTPGPIEIGVMVETPAAAITADLLAAHADFLSVGTNDLTQYGLAMDRGNPRVAGERHDALHPAVLRLIAAAARGARTAWQAYGGVRRPGGGRGRRRRSSSAWASPRAFGPARSRPRDS